MQESSRGADHGSDLSLHVSLYAGNCSEHIFTLLIEYRSGGTPSFHTSSGRVTEIAGRRRGSSASSAVVTSRLFVLPVVARRWVSVDNRSSRRTLTPWNCNMFPANSTQQQMISPREHLPRHPCLRVSSKDGGGDLPPSLPSWMKGIKLAPRS